MLPRGMNNIVSPTQMKDGHCVGMKNLRPNRLKGALQKRFGYRDLVTAAGSAASITDACYYELSTGEGYIVANVAGTINFAQIRSSGAIVRTGQLVPQTTALTGYGIVRGSFTPQRGDNLYYSTCGTTSKQSWFYVMGTSPDVKNYPGMGLLTLEKSLGLTKPADLTTTIETAPSHIQLGCYVYYTTWYDPARNVESLPSNKVTVTASAIATPGSFFSFQFQSLSTATQCGINVTNQSDAAANFALGYYLRVYRVFIADVYLKNIYSIFKARMVGEVTTTTAAFRDAVAEGEAGEIMNLCGTAPLKWCYSTKFGNNWVYSSGDNRVWLSMPDMPENVPQFVKPGTWVKWTPQPIDGFFAEQWIPVDPQVRGMAGSDNALVVGSSQGTYAITGNDARNWRKQKLSDLPCVAGYSMKSTPVGVIWLSNTGLVWWPSQGQVQNLGEVHIDLDAGDLKVLRSSLQNCVGTWVESEKAYALLLPNSAGVFNRILWLHIGGQDDIGFYWDDLSNSLAVGEILTTIFTVTPLGHADFLAVGTSIGRILIEESGKLTTAASYQDCNTPGANIVNTPVNWELDFWTGQETLRTQKSGARIRVYTDGAVDGTATRTLTLTCLGVNNQKVSGTPETLSLVTTTSDSGDKTTTQRGYLHYWTLKETSTVAGSMVITDIEVNPTGGQTGKMQSERPTK